MNALVSLKCFNLVLQKGVIYQPKGKVMGFGRVIPCLEDGGEQKSVV